ncbi:HNH endonuclease [Halobacteriales archaeon SW_7_68_16]|nr:MAG: HNH endonuclease [Halobacteriales archaeon SW_7_68_16]
MTDKDRPYSATYADHTSDEYPPDWQNRRRRVLDRDEYTCQGCGVRGTRVDDVRFDVDHVVPKSDGGSHALGNLQTLCPSCHAEKHAGNSKLERRARRYRNRNRNRSSLVRRLLRIVLVVPVLLSLARSDEGTAEPRTLVDDAGRRLEVSPLDAVGDLPSETGVTVEVVVTDLWSSESDSVHQLGRVADHSVDGDGVRFVIWSGYGHSRLAVGDRYRLIGAETNRYEGEPQLVVDKLTAIRPLD